MYKAQNLTLLLRHTSSHANNVSCVLKRFYDGELVLWRDSIEDAYAVNNLFELHIIHLINFMAANGLLMNRIKTDQLC